MRGVNGGFDQVRREEGAEDTVGEGDVEQRGGEFGRARNKKGMLKGKEGLEEEHMEEGMSL